MIEVNTIDKIVSYSSIKKHAEKYRVINSIIFTSKLFFLTFLHTGRICAGGLDKTKKYRATTLAEIVKLITALIDQPEPSSPVDAGKFFDILLYRYLQF